jgi:hypothetical protein
MTNSHPPNTQPAQPAVYQIRIKGHLGCQWATWFEGMAIRQEANGETIVTGPVIDQAALHGVLSKVRDLGVPLLSIMEVQPDQQDPHNTR